MLITLLTKGFTHLISTSAADFTLISQDLTRIQSHSFSVPLPHTRTLSLIPSVTPSHIHCNTGVGSGATRPFNPIPSFSEIMVVCAA